MPNDLRVSAGVLIPETELEITTSRSGGAGGQHVNKTSSRVTLRWNVAHSVALDDETRARLTHKLASRLTLEGDLILHVDTTRSQIMNRELAFERLVEVVKRALIVPKKRVATKPSRASKARRVDSKKKTGKIKAQRKQSFDDH